ncbi:MAG: TolC family protein, partial [Myxococcota bacterium]
MNRWPTLVALTLFFGGLDSAQAQVVTLSAMRAKALQTRPALAMQDARVASAEAGVDEARAPARPKVAGRLEATASPGSELVTVRDAEDGDTFIVAGSRAIDDGSDAFLPQFRYAARVGVDWNIWDFGRTDAATRAARAELKARQAEAAHTRQSLVAAVDEVYLEWLGAHERASLEAETIRHLDTKLGSLKSKVEAGGLAPSALLSIQADLAAARLRQSYADGAVSLARLAVSEAVGQPLQDSASPDASLLALGAPEKAKTTVDRTEEALAARIEAARATADLHDKRFLPQLQASASAGLRGQFSTLFPFYSARLALELPFDDGGLGAARA